MDDDCTGIETQNKVLEHEPDALLYSSVTGAYPADGGIYIGRLEIDGTVFLC